MASLQFEGVVSSKDEKKKKRKRKITKIRHLLKKKIP